MISPMIGFSGYQEVFGNLLTPGNKCELPIGYLRDTKAGMVKIVGMTMVIDILHMGNITAIE